MQGAFYETDLNEEYKLLKNTMGYDNNNPGVTTLTTHLLR